MPGPKKYERGGLTLTIGQSSVVEIAPRVFRARLTGLLFDTDKTFLLPSAVPALKMMRRMYDDHPSLQLLIVGHADTAGASDHNLALSRERADSLAAFLADDVDTWLGWYQGGKPVSKAWGAHEDQLMLGAVGFADVQSYQSGRGLAADGVAGSDTRRALVGDYMALDEAKLPDGTAVEKHGCGEFHPEVPTANGVAEPRNRRVEIFMFEGAIDPPPRAPCPAPGCPEYAEWVRRLVRSVDFDEAPGSLVVLVTDQAAQPLAGAAVHASGPTPANATSDAGGVARFDLLVPGAYVVLAEKAGFQSGTASATVVSGDVPPAPPAPALLASNDPNFLPSSDLGSPPGGTVVVLGFATGDVIVHVDDGAGHAVPGAKVTLLRSGPSVPITGTTDASGDATFPGVDEATYDVSAEKSGFDPATKPNVFVQGSSSTLIQLVLKPAAELVVTVVDAGGAPVPKAHVDVSGTASATANADAAGAATFKGLKPGAYQVLPHKEGFSADPVPAQVKPGVSNGVKVVLRRNRYKIHPAIGVARVGDHPTAFFIGPEVPGVPANDASTSGFFRAGGKVKRQAARFRIFEYEVKADGSYAAMREITQSEADISWTVTLANTKASFFTFDGTKGETSPRPASDRRNLGVAVADLDIVPGPRTIAGKSGAAAQKFDFANPKIPIKSLGELQTDGDGRLLVLGGAGTSLSTATPTRAPLTTYANNDTWFDDVADGPVSAHIKFKTDKTEFQIGGWTEAAAKSGSPGTDLGGAWVLVGPPDFGPHVGNVVRLLDVLYDIAGLHLTLDKNVVYTGPLRRLKELNTKKKSYEPSYTEEIFPFLRRALEMRWVFAPQPGTGSPPSQSLPSYHVTMDKAQWASLGKKANGMSGTIFAMLRKRAGPHGNTAGAGSMPKLLDDANAPGLVLTETQELMLEQWSKDKFVEDWPGSPPQFKPNPDPAPDELDRAGPENCVGGAFFPGIEVGWQIRSLTIWEEPFRIKNDKSLAPGHFSRQMALPWQADFHDCERDGSQSFFGWWPAQRPDEVVLAATPTKMIPWFRKDGGADLITREDMVDHWSQMGFVVRNTGGGAADMVEQDRGSVP